MLASKNSKVADVQALSPHVHAASHNIPYLVSPQRVESELHASRQYGRGNAVFIDLLDAHIIVMESFAQMARSGSE
jgi:hypothetical protein